MARPTTKDDLITAGNEKYQKFIELIHSFSEEELNGVFEFDIENEKEAHWKRDKNIRDVFIHLYEWHNLLLNWVENNQKVINKQFLRANYNWKTCGKMNEEIWKEHQNTSFEDAFNLLEKSHSQIINLANTFTSEELFSKDTFKWVGGSTLGSYFVSATSSHYDWAIKKIRKYKKSLSKA